MDFIIDLLLTIWGHTSIVVFVDRLTKMVRLAMLRNDFSASDVTDLLINQIFQASWPPHGPRNGQGSEVHVSILPSAYKIVGSTTRDEYIVPSLDGWANKGNE